MDVEHPSLPSPIEQKPVPQPEPENSVNSDTAAPPSLLDFHSNVVQGVCSLGFVREQTPEPMSINKEPASISEEPASPSLSTIHTKMVQTICSLGFDCNKNTFDLQKSLVQCVPELNMRVPPGLDPPTVRSLSNKSWMKNDCTVLSDERSAVCGVQEGFQHAWHTILLQELVVEDCGLDGEARNGVGRVAM